MREWKSLSLITQYNYSTGIYCNVMFCTLFLSCFYFRFLTTPLSLSVEVKAQGLKILSLFQPFINLFNKVFDLSCIGFLYMLSLQSVAFVESSFVFVKGKRSSNLWFENKKANQRCEIYDGDFQSSRLSTCEIPYTYSSQLFNLCYTKVYYVSK